MNLALIIGQRPDRIRGLTASLENLGMRIDACANRQALTDYPARPQVVVWDADARDMLTDGVAHDVPAAVSAASIQLWILPPDVPMPTTGIRVPPSATELQLLPALLLAGYHLPDDAECDAIPQTLNALVDGDAAVVAELIDSLLDTGQTDLADYRARCAEQNWAAAGALAHRIKGTARLAGCASLTRVCERIELAAREDGGTAVLALNALFEPALERLCTVLGRLRQTP